MKLWQVEHSIIRPAQGFRQTIQLLIVLGDQASNSGIAATKLLVIRVVTNINISRNRPNVFKPTGNKTPRPVPLIE
jgi:hypothetical protein